MTITTDGTSARAQALHDVELFDKAVVVLPDWPPCGSTGLATGTSRVNPEIARIMKPIRRNAQA
jgi:hypothetical protein